MKVKIPSSCPQCDSTLDRLNGQLFCRNEDCSGTVLKKIQHFAKVLKVNGVGEATLEKLNLSSVRDFIEISEESLISAIGEKLGTKLYNNLIDKLCSLTLPTLLEALSIPLIGSVASRKLGSKVEKLSDITEEACKDAGLGAVATSNMLNWLDNNIHLYNDIPLEPVNKSLASDKNITVCVTGKVPGYTRESIKTKLESLGVKTTTSISSKTNYLIAEGSSSSSKHKKATELNIPILTIDEFLIKIGER